jgi:hypothetical protein
MRERGERVVVWLWGAVAGHVGHAFSTRWVQHDGLETRGGDVVEQMTREPPTGRGRRSGRTWIVVFVTAVVAALGTRAVIGGNGDDPVVAADLIDEFMAEANNNDDGEAAAALFTSDGVVDMPDGRVSQGHEAIAAHVNEWAPNTDNWERVGDVVETEDGTFTFTARGNWNGTLYEGSGEVELAGDLIARFTWHGGSLLGG